MMLSSLYNLASLRISKLLIYEYILNILAFKPQSAGISVLAHPLTMMNNLKMNNVKLTGLLYRFKRILICNLKNRKLIKP